MKREICPVCGSNDYEVLPWTVPCFHCRNCHFFWKDRKSLPGPADEKKRYELHNNSFNNTGYVNWLDELNQKALYPLIDKSSEILDFGCGPEPVLSKLHEEAGYKSSFYDKYFYPDWPENQFDAITVSEVFEHLAEPVYWAEVLSQLLKAAGVLVLRTQFLSEKPDPNWWYLQDSTHISFYTSSLLIRIFEAFHLRPVFCDDRSLLTLRKTEI